MSSCCSKNVPCATLVYCSTSLLPRVYFIKMVTIVLCVHMLYIINYKSWKGGGNAFTKRKFKGPVIQNTIIQKTNEKEIQSRLNKV